MVPQGLLVQVGWHHWRAEGRILEYGSCPSRLAGVAWLFVPSVSVWPKGGRRQEQEGQAQVEREEPGAQEAQWV